MGEKIQIVFEESSDSRDCVFVETEDMDGKGVGLGEWVKRPDGLWALVVDVASGIRRSTPEPDSESFTVVAESIIKLADGIRLMNESGLSERAIVLLLHDATGVAKKQILKILEALLAERYIRPEPDSS